MFLQYTYTNYGGISVNTSTTLNFFGKNTIERGTCSNAVADNFRGDKIFVVQQY